MAFNPALSYAAGTVGAMLNLRKAFLPVGNAATDAAALQAMIDAAGDGQRIDIFGSFSISTRINITKPVYLVGVAEGAEERPIEAPQRVPGRPVGRRCGVVGRGGDHRGEHPGSGEVGVVGEGSVVRRDHLRRERRGAASGDDLADGEHLGGAGELLPGEEGLGHPTVARGQPGVAHHHPGVALGVLRHQAQPDQTAPVLAEEGDVGEVEPVDERSHRRVRVRVVETEVVHPCCERSAANAGRAAARTGDRLIPAATHPDVVELEHRVARPCHLPANAAGVGDEGGLVGGVPGVGRGEVVVHQRVHRGLGGFAPVAPGAHAIGNGCNGAAFAVAPLPLQQGGKVFIDFIAPGLRGVADVQFKTHAPAPCRFHAQAGACTHRCAQPGPRLPPSSPCCAGRPPVLPPQISAQTLARPLLTQSTAPRGHAIQRCNGAPRGCMDEGVPTCGFDGRSELHRVDAFFVFGIAQAMEPTESR